LVGITNLFNKEKQSHGSKEEEGSSKEACKAQGS